jgi:UDP-N-acetylglucosamine:LPS N-acetylglucosamine transferase
VHLPQAELSTASLAGLLQSFTRERLLAMAQCARALGKPRATDTVADEIEAHARKETA